MTNPSKEEKGEDEAGEMGAGGLKGHTCMDHCMQHYRIVL